MSDEGRRSAARVLVIGALGIVTAVAGFLFFMWTMRATGASCTIDEDCNSRMCLVDVGGDGVCTELCHEDSDCPSHMYCGEGMRSGPGSFYGATRERHVCVPE